MNESIESGSQEITFRELLISTKALVIHVKSKWRLLLFAGILGSTLGFTYSFLKKPVYKAELSFATEDEETGGLGAYANIASQFGFDLGSSGGGVFSGENLLELMKSRLLLQQTLLSTVEIDGRKQLLANIFAEVNGHTKHWKSKKELSTFSFLNTKNSRLKDSLLGEFSEALLKKHISVVKIDKKLDIVKLTVESKNENFSKYFAESLLENVVDFYVKTKTKKAIENIEILQKQTDSVRRELNRAISGVATSSDVNPNSNPALQILRVPSQKRTVDVQANSAILQELVKNLEIAKISLRRATPLVQIIDMPILPLEKKAISKLTGALIGLLISVILAIGFVLITKGIRSLNI